MENINGYLHLYVGCECDYYNEGFSHAPIKGMIKSFSNDKIELYSMRTIEKSYWGYLKLYLRKLSDISDEEMRAVVSFINPKYDDHYGFKFVYEKEPEYQDRLGRYIPFIEVWHLGNSNRSMRYYFNQLSPDQFLYLLNQRFWLWEESFFDKGLIIPKA